MIDTKSSAHGGILPARVSDKECGDTGMAMVLICLLAGWFTHGREWFLAAIVILVINMIWPRLYALPAKVWLGFSHLLGTVMSKIILTLTYFLVLTPIALLRRMLGHDPMQEKQWKQGSGSVFDVRDHTFTPEEIERPF